MPATRTPSSKNHARRAQFVHPRPVNMNPIHVEKTPGRSASYRIKLTTKKKVMCLNHRLIHRRPYLSTGISPGYPLQHACVSLVRSNERSKVITKVRRHGLKAKESNRTTRKGRRKLDRVENRAAGLGSPAGIRVVKAKTAQGLRSKQKRMRRCREKNPKPSECRTRGRAT